MVSWWSDRPCIHMYILEGAWGGSNRPEALMFWWLFHSRTSSVSWLRCRWHVADLHNEEITHNVCLGFTWWRDSLRNLSWEGRQTVSCLLSFNQTTFSSLATHNTQKNKPLKSRGRQVDWVVWNKCFCLMFQDENIPCAFLHRPDPATEYMWSESLLMWLQWGFFFFNIFNIWGIFLLLSVYLQYTYPSKERETVDRTQCGTIEPGHLVVRTMTPLK